MNQIRTHVNIVESALVSQLLIEGRHDDLLKQLFASLAIKDVDNDIITDGQNEWKKIRSSDEFKSLPNKWKYFIAEVLKITILNIAELPVKSKYTDASSVNYLPTAMELVRNMNSILERNPPTLFDNYDPTTANSIESVFKELDEIVAKFKETTKELVEVTGNEEVLFDFGKYKWYDLHTEYCRAEGKAMGHCGNEPSKGDTKERILSLRSSVNISGETYHKPHLTFILDTSNGAIVEARGRGNSKPKKQYHPYIVELLLRDDRIKKIKMKYPDDTDNFVVDDLDDPVEKQKLLDKFKPYYDARDAYEDALKDPDTRHEHLEDIIKDSAKYSVKYAIDVLDGRFEKGEAAIATDPDHSATYAKDILHGKFEEAEDIIATKAKASILYASALNGRFEKGEAVIAANAVASYKYAVVLEGRFEEGEATIMAPDTISTNIGLVINYLSIVEHYDGSEEAGQLLIDHFDKKSLPMLTNKYMDKRGMSIEPLRIFANHVLHDDERQLYVMNNMLDLMAQ